jgi:hypothetical protein
MDLEHISDLWLARAARPVLRHGPIHRACRGGVGEPLRAAGTADRLRAACAPRVSPWVVCDRCVEDRGPHRSCGRPAGNESSWLVRSDQPGPGPIDAASGWSSCRGRAFQARVPIAVRPDGQRFPPQADERAAPRSHFDRGIVARALGGPSHHGPAVLWGGCCQAHRRGARRTTARRGSAAASQGGRPLAWTTSSI